MPKRVVQLYICSLCEAETADPAAIETYTISRRSGGGPVLVDLCEPCQGKPESMARFVAELSYTEGPGSAAAVSPRGDDLVSCPECGGAYSRVGLGQHRARVHGVESDYAKRLATRGKVGDHLCPDCDFRSTHGQGLAAHRNSKHPKAGAKRARKASS